MRGRGLNYLLDRMRPKSSLIFRGFVRESIMRRIKMEEEQEEIDEKNTRHDILHYLLHAKDPQTGAKAYSRAEVCSQREGLFFLFCFALSIFPVYLRRLIRRLTVPTHVTHTTNLCLCTALINRVNPLLISSSLLPKRMFLSLRVQILLQ